MHETGVQNSTERALKKLTNNLTSLQSTKEQIQSYKALLAEKGKDVESVLHLIYVGRNPEDLGARIHAVHSAQIKMSERLTFVDSLIEMHTVFIDALQNDRIDMVLYYAVSSLSAYLGSISDDDDFWKMDCQVGYGFQLVSMLAGYRTALSKAAQSIKSIMDYRAEAEKK